MKTMRALTLTVFAIVTTMVVASRVNVPDHVHGILDHNYNNHLRYYPDFKFEGFEQPHEAQGDHRILRRGINPKDFHENPANPHMANKSSPYPDNVQWLLSMFNHGDGLPRSYNDILPNGLVYWATKTYLSVGAFDENGNSTELDSIIAIQERTLTRYGLNLYDAATWEIALSLWYLYDVAYIYETNILYTGTTGPAGAKNGNPGGIVNIRADSDDFKYGVSKISGASLKQITYPGNVTHFPQQQNGEPADPVKMGPGAFFYRMVGPKYTMVDPMTGAYDNAWKYPWPNPDDRTKWNTFGIIHFNDWKPITGENVWSAIIGPIQALGLQTSNNLTNTSCGNYYVHPHKACDWQTFDTTPPPVQLAISILPALMALQTELGSLYHCPWGSKIYPPDPQEGENVSNENNFSAYAALKMLEAVFANYTNGSSDATLSWASKATTMARQGLDKWFDSDDMLSKPGQLPNSSRVIPQGGHVNSSGYFPARIENVGGLAVDCQTWGMTVLGQPRIDKKFGAGTAYSVWQAAKEFAGYYKGGVLAGVGYTDMTNVNGTNVVPQNSIWSAEWTFGAINMAQTLSKQYGDAGDASKAQSLLNDAQSMYNEVTKLWPEGLRFPDGSYVYANKRFFIPWGWFANPVAATCSTAWSVMQERNFNPFEFYGGSKPELKVPDHLAALRQKEASAPQY
jgi:hypothetical protein